MLGTAFASTRKGEQGDPKLWDDLRLLYNFTRWSCLSRLEVLPAEPGEHTIERIMRTMVGTSQALSRGIRQKQQSPKLPVRVVIDTQNIGIFRYYFVPGEEAHDFTNLVRERAQADGELKAGTFLNMLSVEIARCLLAGAIELPTFETVEATGIRAVFEKRTRSKLVSRIKQIRV
jgi:hypothetical protein